MKVAIIGGGAAGFFAAINVKENHPSADVFIFEKTSKLLSKVKVSGGGRCNVTNACSSIKELSKAYPRGEQMLKRAFRVFSTNHAMEWFERRGVPLVIQDDMCVFPVSQDSQSIIDCFMKESSKKGVKIVMKAGVERILSNNRYLQLHFQKENLPPTNFDKVIVTTGGSPKRKGLEWLESLGHQIEDPVPSLFTFNMPGEPIRELMGIVVENAIVSVQGTKLKADGPLLITHWGMSGPAILKLSAFGARILNEKNYQFKVQINWVNEKNDGLVREELNKIAHDNHQKTISNYRPYQLPKRLWYFLLERCDLPEDKKWGELGKKGINKITNILSNDVYTVSGKTTFKEEFVTCGGLSLKSIHPETMESKACSNLYFAGEVLDIDGITGGYNFQAAWTTAFIASKLL